MTQKKCILPAQCICVFLMTVAVKSYFAKQHKLVDFCEVEPLYSSNKSPTTCNNFIVQTNHQPHATIFQFFILTFIYSSTYIGRSPAHHQELNDCSGSLWFYLRIVVIVMLCSWSGRLDRPRTQHILSPLYEGKTRGCHCSH